MRGDSTINDYIDQIQQQFPYLQESDIRTIVNYGWRMLYLANLAGCDTLLVSQKYKYWMYIGDLCKSSIKHFNYYRRQLCRKIRFLYRRSKQNWDGYYYCFLTADEYNDLIKPRRGRRKHKYRFDNKVAYKVADICNLKFNIPGCVIRFKTLTDRGFQFYSRSLICYDPEIVMVRDKTLTFKDVLVTNNKYMCI